METLMKNLISLEITRTIEVSHEAMKARGISGKK
jgi:hypothetical protein